MKKQLIAAILCGLLISGLAGCGKQPKQPAESVPGSTVKADDTSGIDTSDIIPAEPTAPEESEPPAESSASEPQQPAEKEKSEAEPVPQQTKTESQKPAEPTEPQQPQEPPTVQTQLTAPPESDSSKPAEPAPQEPEPTQPAQPEFDVSYWVSYAKSYAQSIGLELESSAVDCWDNPITAGDHSSCLQRDIESRLNRYSRDEDITDVWIWAEKSSDGSYDLYIGYA